MGLNPHTALTQMSEVVRGEEEEDDDKGEVDSETAYDAFFTAVESARAQAEVVVLDANEGSSSGAADAGTSTSFRHLHLVRPSLDNKGAGAGGPKGMGAATAGMTALSRHRLVCAPRCQAHPILRR